MKKILLCTFGICLCSCILFAQVAPGEIASGVDSPDAGIQLAALAQVERGDAVSRPAVEALLGSPDRQVRRKAASVLGDWADKRSAKALVAALQDGDWQVRATAAWALGRIGDESAIPDLLETAEDESWEARCAAASALGAFPHREDSCRKVRALLSDENRHVRYTAALQLGKWKCPESLPLLHAVVREGKEDDFVLSAVCRALGEIASRESLPLLLDVLEGRKLQSVQESDRALGELAPSCREEILRIFECRANSPERRYNAALLLGRSEAKEAVPALYLIAADGSEAAKIRNVSLLLLENFEGKAAVPFFLEQIASEEPWVQKAAILALGRFREERALPRFWELLRSSDPSVHETSVRAICSLESPRVRELVLRELESPSHGKVCEAAIRLAGALRMSEALPCLRNLSEHPEHGAAARWAIGDLEK